ncbi:hypothetical protein QWZ13_10690 [Reinekea marina]|uniref:Uncharacterized protein n=1 Tax=Reinekea marina TaxID=1310421 RepID=A0ABV7WNL7_9GAMM|nr:hypothetical protein [Reinekea marina]MBU2863174.1 hypothetical protein [Reinekea forsetii]MDN3649378.1 hypothetical protein [Reinekea marina]
MSRSKGSRTMKGKLGIKTGSKKDFIKQGEKGKIPTHNRLEKHKKSRQKSAYQKFLDETGQKDTTNGKQSAQKRIEQAQKIQAKKVSPKPVVKKEKKDFNEMTGDELLNLFK